MGGERAPAIGGGNRARLESDSSVREIINNGISGTGMPAFHLPFDEVDKLIVFVRSRVTPLSQTPVSGDPQTGASLFFGKSGCSGCHMLRGRGGLNGPDLTELPNQLSLAELETSLTNPNSRRQPGYQVATLKLKSGESIRGFIRNESGFDLQLQGFDKKLYLLRRDQIAEINREPGSLMPGFTGSSDEKRDLVAFLAHSSNTPLDAVTPQESLPGAVSWRQVTHPEPGSWPTYHGQLNGNRYTELDQITPQNVAGLSPAWMFNIPGAHSLEGTPIVSAGVMYVTTVNTVYALDARAGRTIWEYTRPTSKPLVGDAASGINRGVALLGDRVFVVTDNAHILALHRLTGALLWDTEMADSHKHYGSTSAPLVVGDVVVSGVSGGDEGIRGFVSGYKVSTGERAWRFWTIPAPGDPEAATWVGRALEHGCGSTWFTGTYDTNSDTLIWPVGNPCPDFNGDERKGDNLYSDSVIALDPATGKLKWHYQFTPHDLHDWDATEVPMLVDADYHGQPRKLLLQGNRNGFFYVLDRENGKFLSASPFVKKLTWTTGIGADGRPILTNAFEPTPNGSEICPSMDGASNWMSTAYSPKTGFFYLMALEKCNVFNKNNEWWKQGESFYGGAARDVAGAKPKKYLRAMDIQTGKIAWEYEQTGPGDAWGGLLCTVTNLLFFGDDNGAFTAVSSLDGKPLWSFQMNAHWHASPMTYLVDGHQYIAIEVGASVVAFDIAGNREK